MKHFAVALLALGTLAPSPAPNPNAAPPGQSGSWTKTFEDSFSGTKLDAAKWNTGYGWGPETNWSGEYCAPENVIVGNGVCRLQLEKRRHHRATAGRNPAQDHPYTSGAINTKGKFSQQFGYFEASIKVAKGQGFLSAFWGKRSDESWPPEIDVVEILGKAPDKAHMTVHYGAKNEQAGQSFPLDGTPNAPDYSADFHVYGVEWTPTQTIFFIDGIERFRTAAGAADINGPFYWMLNVHIGNDDKDWSGQPDASTPWPARMEIDWVRAWKRVDSISAN